MPPKLSPCTGRTIPHSGARRGALRRIAVGARAVRPAPTLRVRISNAANAGRGGIIRQHRGTTDFNRLKCCPPSHPLTEVAAGFACGLGQDKKGRRGQGNLSADGATPCTLLLASLILPNHPTAVTS
ncbi:unnamed protein product [Lampetra fluviatilis]